ncbi:MAG: transcriptional regulator FtsR [Gaiellales bacterium]
MSADPAQTQASKLTIGTVCKMLSEEFGDISISKIRFLEDQKLITPRRTPGGYRLYSEDDVEQLRTILRMQRDEFLPLRVIRQVIAQGAKGTRRPRLVNPDERLSREQLLAETDADSDFVRELHEYGLLEVRDRSDDHPYTRGDTEIVMLCQRLARYGVAARNLRAFRSAVGREAGLLEQILAPSLRSANPERREAGLREMETLADLTSQLAHLLLVRDLRELVR